MSKRRPSVHLEKAEKRQRELTAHERNDALSDYLDALPRPSQGKVSNHAEHQVSFEKLSKLIKKDTIYVDNEEDITKEERLDAEKANEQCVQEFDSVRRALLASAYKNRRRVPPSEKKEAPPTQLRTWNPFQQATANLPDDEQRLVESCAIYSTMLSMKSIWIANQIIFTQLTHFRSMAQQFLSAVPGSDSIIQTTTTAFLSWLVRDEEIIASPMPNCRLVCKLILVVEESGWKFEEVYLVPANVIIVDK